MLPKPNFTTNQLPNTSTNGWQSASSQSSAAVSSGNWFQYNPNQSLVNPMASYQPYQPTNGHQIGNNYHNPYAYGQPYQPYGGYPSTNGGQAFNGNHNYHYNNNYQNFGQNSGQPNGHQNKRFKSQPNNTNRNNNNNNNNVNNNNSKKSFNCDTCCRWFTSQELYDQHISEHIVCGLDECTFKAHPKVIESHQRMQHFCFKDKSLVKRFMSLDSEEDIAKWREERRKHFPTKDNIKLKQEMKEKERLDAIEKRNQMMAAKTNETIADNNSCDKSLDNNKNENKKFNKNNRNNRNNRHKNGKFNDRSNKSMANNHNHNNRKLTLFQKLMMSENENKTETIESIN